MVESPHPPNHHHLKESHKTDMAPPTSKLNGMIRTRRLSLTLMFLLGGALAGCSSPDPTPVFSIDKVRYWFEDDLLVINATLTNRADFTPGQPNTPSPDLI